MGLSKIGFPFSVWVEKEFISTLLIHLCGLAMDLWWHKDGVLGRSTTELTVERYTSQEVSQSSFCQQQLDMKFQILALKYLLWA